ncbi:hypothetical protein V6N13_038776 [Hibiscus sabdariffa]|uniref:Uncharacterized protein n=2 Tax=Hibiscus sabdariffa TaxID=183260 RepID=A0ABR1Z652_9ROSI
MQPSKEEVITHNLENIPETLTANQNIGENSEHQVHYRKKGRETYPYKPPLKLPNPPLSEGATPTKQPKDNTPKKILTVGGEELPSKDRRQQEK